MSIQTILPDDLFRLKFLTGARLSPDAKSAVYIETRIEAETDKDDENDKDEKDEKQLSTLWLYSLETGEARRLTSGAHSDSGPRWSPDGKRLAFVSDRAEKPQIYVIPVDGGEARAVTDLEQGVGGDLAWSPDGKWIAFGAGPEEKTEYDKPYRVTRHIYRFNAMGYFENDAIQDLYIIESDPDADAEPKRLTEDAFANSGPLWSPDGREILYSAGFPPDSHRVFSYFKVVNLEGESRTIAPDWSGYIYRWTPDGENIVFVGKHVEAPVGAQSDLWIVSAKENGAEPESRTPTLDLDVGGGLGGDKLFAGPSVIGITGDSAYVQVQRRGTVRIYKIALSGAESCEPVVIGERACTLLDQAEDTLLFAVSTPNDPMNLYAAKLDGSGEKAITHINADILSERALPEVEALTFKGSDGVEVEGWLMKPLTGKPPYPTILYIHGGPHGAYGYNFSFDFQMLAGAGYAVLYINHRASTGYGDAFSTAITGDWGNLDYNDLMAGVDHAIERGLTDADKLGVCGLSGGGNLSCWIVGQTDRFKAAVPENPVTNFVSFYGVSDIGPWFATAQMGGAPHEIPEVYAKCSPITYAHKCTTPTLLIQGEADWRCPAEQSEQFYTVLKANGCTVEMVRLPNSSHAESIVGDLKVRRAQNDALLGWMNKYVLGIEEEKEKN